ncbi:hypothetical protein GGX14DRAFT_623415 [Mycena pura]|uniref:Uncharacterized protein n=1 Tax=Mycena pura TaxID=153505 RepID=A0AAD6VH22_9AGAR|nr:hypothetical protein GGX14DRAFT_623415 [Mycena pura]
MHRLPSDRRKRATPVLKRRVVNRQAGACSATRTVQRACASWDWWSFEERTRRARRARQGMQGAWCCDVQRGGASCARRGQGRSWQRGQWCVRRAACVACAAVRGGGCKRCRTGAPYPAGAPRPRRGALYALTYLLRDPLHTISAQPLAVTLFSTSLAHLAALVLLLVRPHAVNERPTWWADLSWAAVEGAISVAQGPRFPGRPTPPKPTSSPKSERTPLLPARDCDLDSALDHDLEQLLTLRARDELTDALGTPLVRVPAFIPCLQRLNAPLLTLGLFLLLGAVLFAFAVPLVARACIAGCRVCGVCGERVQRRVHVAASVGQGACGLLCAARCEVQGARQAMVMQRGGLCARREAGCSVGGVGRGDDVHSKQAGGGDVWLVRDEGRSVVHGGTGRRVRVRARARGGETWAHGGMAGRVRRERVGRPAGECEETGRHAVDGRNKRPALNGRLAHPNLATFCDRSAKPSTSPKSLKMPPPTVWTWIETIYVFILKKLQKFHYNPDSANDECEAICARRGMHVQHARRQAAGVYGGCACITQRRQGVQQGMHTTWGWASGGQQHSACRAVHGVHRDLGLCMRHTSATSAAAGRSRLACGEACGGYQRTSVRYARTAAGSSAARAHAYDVRRAAPAWLHMRTASDRARATRGGCVAAGRRRTAYAVHTYEVGTSRTVPTPLRVRVRRAGVGKHAWRPGAGVRCATGRAEAASAAHIIVVRARSTSAASCPASSNRRSLCVSGCVLPSVSVRCARTEEARRAASSKFVVRTRERKHGIEVWGGGLVAGSCALMDVREQGDLETTQVQLQRGHWVGAAYTLSDVRHAGVLYAAEAGRGGVRRWCHIFVVANPSRISEAASVHPLRALRADLHAQYDFDKVVEGDAHEGTAAYDKLVKAAKQWSAHTGTVVLRNATSKLEMRAAVPKAAATPIHGFPIRSVRLSLQPAAKRTDLKNKRLWPWYNIRASVEVPLLGRSTGMYRFHESGRSRL